jgi:hypothetical protein
MINGPITSQIEITATIGIEVAHETNGVMPIGTERTIGIIIGIGIKEIAEAIIGIGIIKSRTATVKSMATDITSMIVATNIVTQNTDEFILAFVRAR